MPMVNFRREYEDIILDKSKRQTIRFNAREWLKRAGMEGFDYEAYCAQGLGRTGILPNRKLTLRNGEPNLLHIWLGNPRSKYARGLKLWIRKLGLTNDRWSVEISLGSVLTRLDARADGFNSLKELRRVLIATYFEKDEDPLGAFEAHHWPIIRFNWVEGPYKDWRKKIIIETVKRGGLLGADYETIRFAVMKPFGCIHSEVDDLLNELMDESILYEPRLGQWVTDNMGTARAYGVV